MGFSKKSPDMFYKINEDGTTSPCNLEEWAEQREKSRDRNIVARYETDEVLVSTVFLGVDHNICGPEPILFETMIFCADKDCPLDQEQWRYSTLQEALIGHEKAVKLAKEQYKDSVGVLLCKKIGNLFADIVKRL